MEKEQEDSNQVQETTVVGKWREKENGEKEMLLKPTAVNDPTCQHVWQYVYTDSENMKNYRCAKCVFGRRSNE